MEEKIEEEEKNLGIIAESFIYKYFLEIDRKYNKDYYLSSIMRFSIIEKIISDYFFKFDINSKNYLLYPLLDFYSEIGSFFYRFITLKQKFTSLSSVFFLL